MTDPSKNEIEARSRQLYDEGARQLEGRFDADIGLIKHETPFGVFHDARGSLAYAAVLLDRGAPENAATAERIISNVASMQERRPQDAHYGNFRWFYEDAGVTDLNAVEFALDGLNHLIRANGERLGGESRDLVLHMIELGLREIDELDVHASYTNIALSDIGNSVLGGEAIGDESYVERGRQRLDEWFEFTNRSGAPHEYNSPTYLAVDIMRMATLAEQTRDPRIALKARVAEERLWLHMASRYHPELAQLAGPHSRSYRDGWTGSGGYLKLILWKLLGDDGLRRKTPYFPKGREEGLLGVAGTTFHCPEYVLGLLRRKRYPYVAQEDADSANGTDLSTYMTAHYALGSASQSYGVGEPREFWQQPNSLLLYFKRDTDPGYGVLYTRYVINDKGAGEVMHESNRVAEDFWDEGRFAGAQHHNRAIAAYALMPRVRPTTSYKMSLRILGVDGASEVWAGDRKVEQYPATIAPGEPIIIAEGSAYIAIIPIEPSDMGADAPIELKLGDQELMLDIYNYRGPAKSFWEHRSQGGPFYKGNVRNAVAIEVADVDEFTDAAAFRRHIASARIADSVDDEYAREIVYASDGGSVSLRYSLWDMEVLERKHDGAGYVAPMGRGGAVDGSGPQWLQSRDALIELSGAKLMAGRTPKWFCADAERGRYVFVNPSDEVAPLWLETPASVVECDAFGFGRVELDEREGLLAIESDDEFGPVRARVRGDLHLVLNGSDVSSMLVGPDADGVRVLGAE